MIVPAIRRNTEASLLVLASVVAVGGYWLTSLALGTDIPTASLPSVYQRRLRDGITANGRKEAVRTVENLRQLELPPETSPSPGTAPGASLSGDASPGTAPSGQGSASPGASGPGTSAPGGAPGGATAP